MSASGSGTGLSAASDIMRRRRSVPSRKPRPKEQLLAEYCDLPGAHSNSRSVSAEDDAGLNGANRKKEFYLNNPNPRNAIANASEGSSGSKKTKRDDRSRGDNDGRTRHSESVAPVHLRNAGSSRSHDGHAEKSGGSHDARPSAGDPGENKVRKVKLKIGGVTRTIHAKSNPISHENATPNLTDTSPHRHKNKVDHKRESSGSKLHLDRKETTRDNVIEGGSDAKQSNRQIAHSSDPVRKSKRVPKKRSLVGESDEDNESRHHKKLKLSEVMPEQSASVEETPEDSANKRKGSKLSRSRNISYEMDEDFTVSRSGRDRRKLRQNGSDFIDDEPVLDTNTQTKKKQKEAEIAVEIKPEPLTTRQRALQGKGGSMESLIEFPNGLPSAPSRKQKGKLSEMEIQAKKAEAAQRRKLQVEKAAKEAQEEAIRKILGLDSDKKKEEKKQKEREEMEKAAKAQLNVGNVIRWVIGPNGTTVTFPDDVELPSVLTSKPCSYPPPREKCAGPSCTNPYKYRDSKSKLPLCSLECYKAVQGITGTPTSV